MSDVGHLLAADLLLRVGVDTTGVDAELSSKLTSAERQAQLTADRVSASAGRVASAGAVSSDKVTAATLRQSAAQESYNRLLRAGETDTVRLARAQAAALSSRLTAQRTVAAEQTRLSSSVVPGAATGGLLGGTRGLIGAAAGLGAFAAVRSGVRTFEQLTGSVRQLQRATGATAEDSSRLNAILDRYGLTGERATQAMLRLGKNIADKPAVLQKFGVEIAHNADGTTNLTQTLLNANEAFHRTPDAATRASLALSVFGRGGQSLLPILSANRDTLKGFMDEAQRSGLVFTQADLERAKALAESQRNLTQAWQGFEIVLAQGVVPALHDFDNIATRVMHFFENHQTIANATLRFGELAGALFIVSKAMKALEAVRASTLLTSMGTSARSAALANAELATSEAAVGAAAAAATPSVAALDVAESAGGAGGFRAGATAVAGGLAARGGALLNSPLAKALILPYVGYEAYKYETKLLDKFGLPGIAPPSKPQDLLNPSGHALVTEYGSVDAAIAALRAQNQQRDLAATQDKQASLAAYTGDPFAAPPASPRRQLNNAVANAQSAETQAQRRVGEAEQALALARRTDTTTALQLTKAEDALATAKDNSAKASRNLSTAEDKRRKGLAPSVLTPEQLQHRLDRSVASARDNLEAFGVLSGEGLKRDALTRLIGLDKQNPGTLKYAAEHFSKSAIEEMNASFRKEKRLNSPIADYLANDPAARKAGARAAQQFALGFDNGLSRLAKRKNREDYFSPQDSRSRSYALSGGVGPGMRRTNF